MTIPAWLSVSLGNTVASVFSLIFSNSGCSEEGIWLITVVFGQDDTVKCGNVDFFGIKNYKYMLNSASLLSVHSVIHHVDLKKEFGWSSRNSWGSTLQSVCVYLHPSAAFTVHDVTWLDWKLYFPETKEIKLIKFYLVDQLWSLTIDPFSDSSKTTVQPLYSRGHSRLSCGYVVEKTKPT